MFIFVHHPESDTYPQQNLHLVGYFVIFGRFILLPILHAVPQLFQNIGIPSFVIGLIQSGNYFLTFIGKLGPEENVKKYFVSCGD